MDPVCGVAARCDDFFDQNVWMIMERSWGCFRDLQELILIFIYIYIYI